MGSAELRKRVPFTFTSSPVSESLKQARSGVKKEKKLRIYTKNSWFDYFFLFCFVLFCFFLWFELSRVELYRSVI